MRIGQESNGFA